MPSIPRPSARFAIRLGLIVALPLSGCAMASPVRTVLVGDRTAECMRFEDRIECVAFDEKLEFNWPTTLKWSLTALRPEQVTPGIERCHVMDRCALRAPVAMPEALIGKWNIGTFETPDAQIEGAPEALVIQRVPGEPTWFAVSNEHAHVTTAVRGDNDEVWLVGLERGSQIFRFSPVSASGKPGWHLIAKDGWRPLRPLGKAPDAMQAVLKGQLTRVPSVGSTAVKRLFLTQADALSPAAKDVDTQLVLHQQWARLAMGDGKFAKARSHLRAAITLINDPKSHSRYPSKATRIASLRPLQLELERRAGNWRAVVKVRTQMRDALSPSAYRYCEAVQAVVEVHLGIDDLPGARTAMAVAPQCKTSSLALMMAVSAGDTAQIDDLLSAAEGPGPTTSRPRELSELNGLSGLKMTAPVPELVSLVRQSLNHPARARLAAVSAFKRCQSQIDCLLALAIHFNVLPAFVKTTLSLMDAQRAPIAVGAYALRTNDLDAAIHALTAFTQESELAPWYAWGLLGEAQRRKGDTASARVSFERGLVLSGMHRPALAPLWTRGAVFGNQLDSEEVRTAALTGSGRDAMSSRMLLLAERPATPAEHAALLASLMDDSWYRRPSKWVWQRADALARQSAGPTTALTLIRYWHHRALRATDAAQRLRFEAQARAQFAHLPDSLRQAWTQLEDARTGQTVDLAALRGQAHPSSATAVRQLAHWTLGVVLEDAEAAGQRLAAAIALNGSDETDSGQSDAAKFERLLRLACDLKRRDPRQSLSFVSFGEGASNDDFAKRYLREQCQPIRQAPDVARWRPLVGRWEFDFVATAKLSKVPTGGKRPPKLPQMRMELLADGQMTATLNKRITQASYRAVAEGPTGLVLVLSIRGEPSEVQMQIDGDRLTLVGQLPGRQDTPKTPMVFRRVGTRMPAP